jgi:hypothetical protein
LKTAGGSIELIGHDCLMQAWWFLHSVVVWQNCARPIVLLGVPGQFMPSGSVVQDVIAVIVVESANPQHTCPLGHSDASTHLITALFGGHDCAWGMQVACKS